MITEKTVFVLGAGASVPFGFPTGAKLREDICHLARRGYAFNEFLQRCGHSEHAIEHFRDEFQRSAVASIDTFIGFRPNFQELAELSIAANLLPLENPKALLEAGGRSGNSDWYQLLWSELLVGVSEPTDFLKNSASFVSFNYDRSLEHFLHGAISATFGLTSDDAHDVLAQVRIHHVYGTLGPYSRTAFLPYGGHDEAALVAAMKAARDFIKTVPTVRSPIDQISADWLAEAQRVFVLGYGFDATNCDRIGLKNACGLASKQVTPRQVFASAYNLTSAEIRRNEQNSCKSGQGGLIWTSGDCMTLLRDRKDLLL